MLRRQAAVEEEFKVDCRATGSGYFCAHCDKDVQGAMYSRHIASDAHKVLKAAAKERALTTLAEHLERLDFLFKPTGGIIMRTLSVGHVSVNFSLKKEMLELVLLIISAHGSPLTRNKAHVDAYIRYALLSVMLCVCVRVC